jgi:hypothetical protein
MNVIKLFRTSPTKGHHSPSSDNQDYFLRFDEDTNSPQKDKKTTLSRPNVKSKREEEQIKKSNTRKLINAKRLVDHTDKILNNLDQLDAKQCQTAQIVIF